MRRKRKARWIRSAFAFAGGALALAGLEGCTALSELSENQCGNRVVEEAAGEDCDGQAGCAAAGAKNECRYTCDRIENPSCPAGYGCGADGICRRPRGELSPIHTGTTATARDLLVGDINGDGCAEAVITGARGTAIEAFESSRSDSCVAAEQTIATSRPDPNQDLLPQPALVDLSEGESRLSLVAGARGLFGDGLSLFFTSGEPTVKPVLFPLFQRPGSTPRTLRLRVGGEDAVLFLEQSKDGKTDATLFFGAHDQPENFAGALPFLPGSITALVAADVEDDAAPADQRCDEVIIATQSNTHVLLYHICEGNNKKTFAPLSSAYISLDAGASLRMTNQSIAAIDLNGDGHKELVVNASDKSLHAAYGLGDGRFHSKPPPVGVTDQTTAPLDLANSMDLTQENSIFVAGEFDANHPGPELVGLACPPSGSFRSPTCDEEPGGCEAIVADIDGDGDDDIVSTEGQAVDVTVRRRVSDGTFHISYLRTSCPPHQLDVGDLNGDGIGDIAFFDQSSKGPDQNATSLAVAYGNASAEPSAPVASGRFDEAAALAVARLSDMPGGSQLAIARSLDAGKKGSALGIAEIDDDGAVSAPFYFPSSSPAGEPIQEVTLVAQAAGRFITSSDGAAGTALAVITKASGGSDALWLIGNNADAGSLTAAAMSSATEVPCDNRCALAALPMGGGAADRLLLLGDGGIVVYEVQSGAFVEVDQITSTHVFRSIIDGSNPPKYAPRPLVGLFDDDDLPDVLAQDASGALVGLFGREDGQFDEIELLAAPSCDSAMSCAGFAAAPIDADGDGINELAVVGPGTLAVYSVETSGAERSLAQKSVELSIPAPPKEADFTALSAADVDGDGVKDLVLMTSSNFFTVLRGQPERE